MNSKNACIAATSILLLLSIAASPPVPGAGNPTTASRKTIVTTTQPVSVPFKLTATNHILVRLKINGQGPFNLIVDTGCPILILRVSAAQKIGLKPNRRGMVNLKEMEIEGGIQLKNVQCLVETPYQIEGMNAIGAAGVDLDGMLGYSVLARFRLQLNMGQDRMVWTPLNFSPPPFPLMRTSARAPTDAKEDQLESMGGIMKMLGPLIRPADIEAKHRGVLGIQLQQTDEQVLVQSVLGDSPADKAGILPGDRIVSVNKQSVASIADAQRAIANTLANQTARVTVERQEAELTLSVTCADGM